MASLRIDTSFAICGLCGEEQDSGLGFSKDKYATTVWVCRECVPFAKHAMKFDQLERSRFDKEARDIAGQHAAEYLEGIGKLDLATLNEDEWTRFLDILFRKKAAELRRLLAPYCPPF